MFIRSKHENTNKNDALQIHTNPPVKISSINKIELFITRPYNKIDFGNGVEWAYTEKEHACSEYEWILSKLDCVVNEEKEPKQPRNPVDRPTISKTM